MKILVVSDTHGHDENLMRVLQREWPIDALIHCGDLEGSEDYIPEAVDKLRQEGYTVCAVEQAEGSVMLDNLQLDKTKKYAIVMGNEVKGVQQNVVDNCDICIEIPQYGTKHSLNVSVTTGIVIWDFFKQLSD